MRRACLSIVALVLVLAQPTRGDPPYTFKRADYVAKLAAAKNDLQRLEVLTDRWKAIKLAVAHAHVVTDNAFHRTMALWTRKYLSTGTWTVNTGGDLTKPVRGNAATVFVHGDCRKPVHVTNDALVHVFGNLTSEIKVQGHCEVLIGGDITKTGSVRGDGIVRVFVGGHVHGAVRNGESSTVWIAGNLHGEVGTGTPSTDLHVMGDIVGKIGPVGDTALLSVEAHGFVPARVILTTAQHKYTEFHATVGSSDRPAGLYAIGQATWVIHAQK